ncbi:hypothetical protein B0H14DRAFT_2905942 [Mycena olivaceomarginata]|nr:hypothetical protein B0H14DRAFT_2905942 [Mycena olivaceomarginata]
MSAYLTFTDKENLEGSLLLPNGRIHSTLTTGTRTLARKGGSVPRQTTVVAESTNTRGKISWEARTFTIDGVERSVNTLRERVWDNKDKWTWGETSYTVRFLSEHGEWTARPTRGWTDVARLEQRTDAPPALVLSAELQDERERMFMVLVLIFSKGIRSW